MRNYDANRADLRKTKAGLLQAIDQVSQDVAKVELWATALDGCARPVPDYDLGRMAVWLPGEQARGLPIKS